MGSHLDIALSILLAMMLILMIFNYNNDMVDANFINNLYYAAQKHAYEFQEILECQWINLDIYMSACECSAKFLVHTVRKAVSGWQSAIRPTLVGLLRAGKKLHIEN